MAVIMLYQHRVDDAEKNAQEALALNPHGPNAYLVLADVHGQRHDFPTEIKDLDTYLTLAPHGGLLSDWPKRLPLSKSKR